MPASLKLVTTTGRRVPPDAAPADGYLMLTVPAHTLQSGDIVGLNGTWSTVGRVTVENDEPASTVHVVLDDHGRDRRHSWRILAGENVAVLRRAAERITATSNADAAGWYDTPGGAA